MTAMDLTSQEKTSGKISPEHLQQAVRALHADGYVILNELVERSHAEILAQKMIEDVQFILQRKDVPFNFNVGNLQQDPPPFHPYLFRDVLLNDIVIAITRSILGPGLKNAFYSGNTALPRQGGRQPVHADMGQLWPNLTTATPAYALVVNVLPVDVSPENGSTEIWPGTHLDTSTSIQQGEIKVPEEKLAERRKIATGFQYSARAGSVVIRDIRMWHAGMPNRSTIPRPMIAMIHYVSWWSDLKPLVFPKGTEDFFQHPELITVARFVDGEVDYLNRNEAFDLMK
jgi:ectoine hydroxylase-related dioxygenase (phytanoyl-CoA dioxygenase family)